MVDDTHADNGMRSDEAATLTHKTKRQKNAAVNATFHENSKLLSVKSKALSLIFKVDIVRSALKA